MLLKKQIRNACILKKKACNACIYLDKEIVKHLLDLLQVNSNCTGKKVGRRARAPEARELVLAVPLFNPYNSSRLVASLNTCLPCGFLPLGMLTKLRKFLIKTSSCN